MPAIVFFDMSKQDTKQLIYYVDFRLFIFQSLCYEALLFGTLKVTSIYQFLKIANISFEK